MVTASTPRPEIGFRLSPPLWVGREFSVGRTYAAHPLQHRRDPGRARLGQRARQSERVRLPASSVLRTYFARCWEMSAQAYREDVEFSTGVLLLGVPFVSLRREPGSRFDDNTVRCRSPHYVGLVVFDPIIFLQAIRHDLCGRCFQKLSRSISELTDRHIMAFQTTTR